MPSDDELRRVAEDVRALARSLARDVRSAADRLRDDAYGASPGSDSEGHSGSGSHSRSRERRSAREDFADAGRAAREEFRRAQRAFRRSGHYGYWPPPNGAPAPGSDPEGADDTGSSPPPGAASWGGYGPRWEEWGRCPRHHYARDVAVRERPPKAERAPKPVPVPSPPLRHRHDGSTLVGLLAVVFGLAWLITGLHVAHVSAVAVVAVALMVVGVALVVTARTDWALSRRAWPILGGGMLAATLLAFSISPNLPVGFQHLSFGEKAIAPTTWSALPATIHGGFGRSVIDLTGLSGQPPVATTLTVDNAAGKLLIMVPPTLKVVIDAAVSAGQIDVNGQFTSGVGRSVSETLNPATAGAPLTIKVESGFGDTVITSDIVTVAPTPVAPAAPKGPSGP